MKRTFDRLGIPEAEQKFLAGVGAQYDTEVVYHSIREDLEKQGVSFSRPITRCATIRSCSASISARSSRRPTTSLRRSTRAVWSGGSFIYVPKGVRVEMPLQAYFRINAKNMGQFERTLIIVDEGAYRALRRGLHRAHLLLRLAPRRRRRDLRQERTRAAATPPSRTGRPMSTTW